jgi:hypothetical protein
MPVPGVADSPTTFSGGGLADYSGLHSALLAVKVWSTAASSYVWSGDGIAPDPLSYTQILFVDPAGTHNPTTSPGGRSNVNDLWETGAVGTTVATDTLWDTKGDLAAATGPDAAVKVPVGANGQVLTADSTQTTGIKWAAAGGGGGGGLLASTAYLPGSLTSIGATTTWNNVDGANLLVTFTAPASGKVFVDLSAVAESQNSSTLAWGIQSGGSNVAIADVNYNGTSSDLQLRLVCPLFVTGLTPGNSYTYTFAHARTFGSTALTVYGPGKGAAIMQVWSA